MKDENPDKENEIYMISIGRRGNENNNIKKDKGAYESREDCIDVVESLRRLDKAELCGRAFGLSDKPLLPYLSIGGEHRDPSTLSEYTIQIRPDRFCLSLVRSQNVYTRNIARGHARPSYSEN